LLPRSWIGLYLYDLSFRSNKTVREIILYNILNLLRIIKKIVVRQSTAENNPQRTLYGFRRWEPVVEGRCTIHMPWYDNRRWKRINLQVAPSVRVFEIAVNDLPADTVTSEGGLLAVDVPLLDDPYRTISIRSCDGGRWRLVRFGC
jgi:hypothetical protein